MMLRFTSLIFLSLFFLSNSNAQTATWNDNVACILYTRCTSCHHEGGIGPFSLMTYQDASSAAFGMQYAVNTGTMPPWPPDETYRSLAHERVLTPEEIAVINEWVNSGMPEGNGTAPMAPVYTSSEVITDPDIVLTMPSYTVATVGNDVYRCFVIPTGLSEDVFIKELEVVPGNREAVHHVLLYADASNTPVQLDANDPLPGYVSFGGTGSNASTLVGGWVPGQGVKVYPGIMGVKIPAGANIIMQVHYPATANGQTDQTKVNIKYTTGSVREVSIGAALNHGDLNEGALIVPANQTRTFTATYQVPANANVTVLDVAPHMHLIGRSVKAWAVTPTNVTIPLIDIPSWNFHWQGFYDFRQPLKIPAGSVLYSEAMYDNTSANPWNPSNPPQLVTVGEATTDEMMLIYFSYTLYSPGDENIVVDTATVVTTYNNCNYQLVGIGEEMATPQFRPYPNPTSGQLHVNLPLGEKATIRLIDALGRVVMQQQFANQAIDVLGFANGLYQLQVELNGAISSRKVLIQH